MHGLLVGDSDDGSTTTSAESGLDNVRGSDEELVEIDSGAWRSTQDYEVATKSAGSSDR